MVSKIREIRCASVRIVADRRHVVPKLRYGIGGGKLGDDEERQAGACDTSPSSLRGDDRKRKAARTDQCSDCDQHRRRIAPRLGSRTDRVLRLEIQIRHEREHRSKCRGHDASSRATFPQGGRSEACEDRDRIAETEFGVLRKLDQLKKRKSPRPVYQWIAIPLEDAIECDRSEEQHDRSSLVAAPHRGDQCDDGEHQERASEEPSHARRRDASDDRAPRQSEHERGNLGDHPEGPAAVRGEARDASAERARVVLIVRTADVLDERHDGDRADEHPARMARNEGKRCPDASGWNGSDSQNCVERRNGEREKRRFRHSSKVGQAARQREGCATRPVGAAYDELRCPQQRRQPDIDRKMRNVVVEQIIAGKSGSQTRDGSCVSIGEKSHEKRCEPARQKEPEDDEPVVCPRRRVHRQQRGKRVEWLRLHGAVERYAVPGVRVPKGKAMFFPHDAVLDREPRFTLKRGRACV